MELEPSSAEHSPPYSENNRSWSWNQVTDEVSSFTDSNNELCGLMEDKEVAARAVAFVVNSTRKGIVPLCADVANLMRTKQCLERKLRILRRENDAFRSSLNGGSVPSHSMSPTPPSLSSYTEQCIKSLQEQSLAIQEHFRSNSRCSNSSSSYSYSPKLDKNKGGIYSYSPKLDKPCGGTLRPVGVQYSPASSSDSRKHGSSRSIPSNLSAFRESQRSHPRSQLLLNSEHAQSRDSKPETINEDGVCDIDLTTCIVGDLSSDIFSNIEKLNLSEKYKDDEETAIEEKTEESSHVKHNELVSLHIEDETVCVKTEEESKHCDDDKDEFEMKINIDQEQFKTEKSLLERRRVSLPEITTIPNLKAIKIKSKQSKEVQCCLDKTDRNKDQSLEEQFMKSVRLNAKLEEDLNEARKEIDQLKKRLKRMESSGAIPKTYGQTDEEKVTEDNGYYTGSNRTSRTGSEHERISLFKKPAAKRQAITSVSYVGPIPNCKCSTCHDALGSEDDLSHYSDVYLDEPHRYAVNSKLQVQLDDHVTTKGGYSGYIRYIGHVDKIDQSHALFVGLELDTAAGTSDGSFLGKRYFYCRKNYGMFAPLTDVIGKSLLKATKEEILKVKKSSKKSSKDDKITHL
ncbi:uncharacterized protein LOC123538349 isoform X2 [Mercenaria mercenaria]|uniref:uncharacterized protein LOC123538349 isoform X2 n=1 Tax=Mercenaria mercenaria TaxID=6596 RepID=UPI00234F3B01|nr:uncharacterized protein LOC123538349 isoform X2 [Mercenaria mercenaria]